MPARRIPQTDDIDFGSDSFLDVIANIVGILVILIVVAGLRVKHAPPNLDGADVSTEHAKQAAAILAENAASLAKEAADWEAYRAESAKRQKLAVTQRADAVEWAARLESQKRAIAQRSELQSRIDATVASWRVQATELEAEIARRQASLGNPSAPPDLDAKTQRDRANLQFWRQQEDKLLERERQLAATLAEKRKELAALNPNDKPIKTLVHYSSPIATPLSKKELHFRLEGGKVDFVPLDALIDRVRIELSLRDDKSESTFQGVAGPVEGFRLRYSFVAAQSSLSEIMASGSRKLQLVSFEVIPPIEDQRETVARALLDGSRLLERLKANPPAGAAVTLWVYANAFADLQPLQQRLHEEGYLVALRPLPAGASISGSPMGTASRGQ